MRRKRELLENGPAVFGKDSALLTYEKRKRLLGRKEVEITLLENLTDGSS